MWKSKREFEFIVSETINQLDLIKVYLSPGYKKLSVLIKGLKPGPVKDILQDVEYSVADAYAEIEKYLELFRGISIEYKSEVEDRLEQLEIENIQLKERLRLLEEVQGEQDLVRRANSLLDIFEHRVENLAQIDTFVKKCKVPKKGEQTPNFTHEVNTDELVELYEKAGCKLTEDIVNHFQAKAPIGYNGLRMRLVSAGVWKGRQKE